MSATPAAALQRVTREEPKAVARGLRDGRNTGMIEDQLTLQTDGETCVVCGKSVEHGRGYCRIMHKKKMANLCCPLCQETFLKAPDRYLSHQKTTEELRAMNELLKPKSAEKPPQRCRKATEQLK